MLIQIYIEALLVDEKKADQVWSAWYVGQINDTAAARIHVRQCHLPFYLSKSSPEKGCQR